MADQLERMLAQADGARQQLQAVPEPPNLRKLGANSEVALLSGQAFMVAETTNALTKMIADGKPLMAVRAVRGDGKKLPIKIRVEAVSYVADLPPEA